MLRGLRWCRWRSSAAVLLLAKAEADSKRFLELNPEGDSAYWSKYDETLLKQVGETVRIAALPDIAEADWFKPGNPESPKVVRAIAQKFDEAWAKDAPKGVAGAFQTYRDLVKALVYDRAIPSGNMAPAKRAIALAAQGHANGEFRATANRDLKAPPEFLWNWIDPEIKPRPAR
ncbi:MAG: hypothetical protein SGJ21_01565 [Alphaproteobacteria bacterium]|nr:hypothetical protein [Alphaproteobacteria bacterium]